jgi:hypothetical protein
MLTKTTATVAVLATAAIAAPSAGARPADSVRPAAAGTTPQVVTRTVEAPSSGFDWTDAGLGAAGTLSLLGLGAVIVARRRHPKLG